MILALNRTLHLFYAAAKKKKFTWVVRLCAICNSIAHTSLKFPVTVHWREMSLSWDSIVRCDRLALRTLLTNKRLIIRRRGADCIQKTVGRRTRNCKRTRTPPSPSPVRFGWCFIRLFCRSKPTFLNEIADRTT